MKYLYKYPQAEYPVSAPDRGEPRARRAAARVRTARHGHVRRRPLLRHLRRIREALAEDIFIRIEAFNRGPEPAPLHLLPHLWFRNTWGWGADPRRSLRSRLGPREMLSALLRMTERGSAARIFRSLPARETISVRRARRQRRCSPTTKRMRPRVYGAARSSRSRFVKDAFHRHIVHGEDVP